MNAKPMLVLFLTAFLLSKASAQNTGSSFKTLSPVVSVSYYGNILIKPGIKAGVEMALLQKSVNRKESRHLNRKVRIKQLTASADLGMLLFPGSHSALFNYYTVNYKNIKTETGKFNTVGIGPGIYRSFYSQTYEVDASGNVTPEGTEGRSYFAPVLVFGTGKYLSHGILQSWHFNTSIIFLFDYNTGIVPLLNFEIGTTLNFFKRK